MTNLCFLFLHLLGAIQIIRDILRGEHFLFLKHCPTCACIKKSKTKLKTKKSKILNDIKIKL